MVGRAAESVNAGHSGSRGAGPALHAFGKCQSVAGSVGDVVEVELLEAGVNRDYERLAAVLDNNRISRSRWQYRQIRRGGSLDSYVAGIANVVAAEVPERLDRAVWVVVAGLVAGAMKGFGVGFGDYLVYSIIVKLGRVPGITERILLHKRHCGVEPGLPVGVKTAGRQFIMMIVIGVHRQADLLEIVGALHPSRRFPRCLHRRQQKGD